jgi:hypothetical protein
MTLAASVKRAAERAAPSGMSAKAAGDRNSVCASIELPPRAELSTTAAASNHFTRKVMTRSADQ